MPRWYRNAKKRQRVIAYQRALGAGVYTVQEMRALEQG